MKIYLCIPRKDKCPAVEIKGNEVLIGEDSNTCTLTKEQFKILKNKIKNNEL